MKTIYKSEGGKKKILALYDSQLSRLSVPWRDIYVQTSFGVTHIVETGNPRGEPLLVFHGGNATTAYNLLACGFLIEDFHIYGVDIIGHSGKSAETSLPAKGYAYGQWAGEVIAGLGYDRMCLFGGSFGGGIVAKAMCEVPDKVKKAVLYIPSGIRNAPAIKSASMMIPMMLYWITHREKWLKQCFMPMAITEDNITDDIFQTAKLSIDYVKEIPHNARGAFNYQTVCLHILSGILYKATGMKTADYANARLFGPLGIQNRTNYMAKTAEEHRQFVISKLPKAPVWFCDPEGLGTPGYGLCMSAEEMAKAGLLCLNKGQINGRQIVSSEWIKEMTSPRPVEGNHFRGMQYGYLWWIIDEEKRIYAAIGNSGNVIYVNPESNTVISVASTFKPTVMDRVDFIQEYVEPFVSGI